MKIYRVLFKLSDCDEPVKWYDHDVHLGYNCIDVDGPEAVDDDTDLTYVLSGFEKSFTGTISDVRIHKTCEIH